MFDTKLLERANVERGQHEYMANKILEQCFDTLMCRYHMLGFSKYGVSVDVDFPASKEALDIVISTLRKRGWPQTKLSESEELIFIK